MDLTQSEKYIPVPARLLRRRGLYFLPISLGLAILIWETVVKVGNFPAFILPSPGAVGLRFIQVLEDGTLLSNTLATLKEVLAGLGLGALAAMLLGYLLAKSPTFERLFGPYIVASQAIPTVAIAPLLWRLAHDGLDLPKSAAPLAKYAERIFQRPAYIEALTPSEKVMRK